jgi:hypothetical protein
MEIQSSSTSMCKNPSVVSSQLSVVSSQLSVVTYVPGQLLPMFPARNSFIRVNSCSGSCLFVDLFLVAA